MDFGKAPEPGTIALIVFTALVGVLMGVFGKAAAEWLLNLIVRPVRFVKEALYSWLAPRNPLSISLRSYRRHVSRSNLTRIENPVGPNLEVPLEHAFAPLKLISGATEDSVDLFAQAASSHRCIVLGGPGTGKTTLMKSLVTSVVKGRAREEELRDLIPVFVVLRNLARREHTVEQAVVAAFADHHFPGAEKFVESALEQGKLLVILDGLDEVGAGRDFVAEQIQKFCEYDDQRAHRNRLFVTCREHSYRTRDLQGVIPEVVRVEPFANHHMRVFLQGWPAHKGRTAMKLYGLIQDDPQIRDICRNPLLLTILTGLYLDTDNFELPSSRERFYKDAVDELLVHRPARRNVKQAFDADDKRQILERVALDRLETAERHEDPEEFTREVIRRKAEEVLRRDDFDPRELIKELVEVNGIIKPGHEGSYTCAHRTIQEYFAAREARRKRETREVVEHFGSRPEFIEVLYFYCGLVDNLPSLAYVVNTLVSQQRWPEAARCILYMKEPPDASLVERVARELQDLISPFAEYKAALEVLSSLAQRRAPEFDSARELFARAIDNFTEGYGERGAAALESALATSPEAAMKVIPGLLKHRAPRWREAAVRLLRDIGTDEALDKLVLLLNDPDPVVKAHAGRALAEMLKSRPHDLRARAALLPPRADSTVWPLEEYFPGRLAIPIAESLADSAHTRSGAIDCAARALRARVGGVERSERAFLKHWRRVPRDLRLRRRRRRAGRAVVVCVFAVFAACFFAFFSLHVRNYWREEVWLLTVSPFRLHRVQAGWLMQVRERAQAVADEIEQRYPSDESRGLPAEEDRSYQIVKKWALVTNPYEPPAEREDILALRDVASVDKFDGLLASISTLERNVPDVRGGTYIFIGRASATALVSILLVTSAFTWFVASIMMSMIYTGEIELPLLRGVARRTRVILRNAPAVLGHVGNGWGMAVNLTVIGPLVIMWALTYDRAEQSVWFLSPLALLAAGLVAGWFLQRFDWPGNPLLPAASDVVQLRNEDRRQEFEKILSAVMLNPS
ncbi:MAG TPA: NACHT domain-containing protein [Pyrinomonadaceae bacterium]